MLANEAIDYDWSVSMRDDHRELDSEEDNGEDRTFWYIDGKCGLGGCSDKKFPNQFGCWSYVSSNACRYRYALHLYKHPEHKLKMMDALYRAFNTDQTKVARDATTKEERDENRRWSKENAAAAPVADRPRRKRRRRRSTAADNMDAVPEQLRHSDEDDDGDIPITYENRQLAHQSRIPVAELWHRDAIEDCRQKIRWAETELRNAFREVAQSLRRLPDVMNALTSAVDRFNEIPSAQEVEPPPQRRRRR